MSGTDGLARVAWIRRSYADVVAFCKEQEKRLEGRQPHTPPVLLYTVITQDRILMSMEHFIECMVRMSVRGERLTASSIKVHGVVIQWTTLSAAQKFSNAIGVVI